MTRAERHKAERLVGRATRLYYLITKTKVMEKQQIVQAIKDYQARTGNSQNRTAKMIGVSPAHLSNILAGPSKWKLVSKEMWNRVHKFFARDVDEWPIFQTKNFNTIINLCLDAQSNSRMLAISAYTGAGKTTALEHYSKSKPNAYYVLGNFMMGKKDFVMAIQKALGIEQGSKIIDMIGAIINRLNQMDNPVLIIDDAGKLRDSNFRILQIIYDETERKAGLVLGGTEYLKEYIDKMSQKNKMGFRELRRRIGYWQALYPITPNMVAEICGHHGISDKNAMRFIAREATNYGALRELITNAKRISENGIDANVLNEVRYGEKDFEIKNT